MWLAQTSMFLMKNANEVCFTAAMVISLAFFRQYRKYELEAEREEQVEQLLH